jgi:hypothetical protein
MHAKLRKEANQVKSHHKFDREETKKNPKKTAREGIAKQDEK